MPRPGSSWAETVQRNAIDSTSIERVPLRGSVISERSAQRTRFNLRAQSDHHDVCPQQHRCRREAHGSQPLPSREAPARFKPMLGRSTESRRFTKVARPVRSRSEISDTFQSPRRSSLASSARLHQSLLAGRRDLPAPTFQVATALCFDECLQFLRLRHSRTARRHQPGSACEPPQQRPPSREPPHRSTRPRHSHRGGLLQPCTSQRSQVTPSRCRAAVRLPNLTRRCRKPPARSQPRSRCPSEHLPKQTHARPRAPDSLLARCPTVQVSAAWCERKRAPRLLQTGVMRARLVPSPSRLAARVLESGSCRLSRERPAQGPHAENEGRGQHRLQPKLASCP
jgi:hypothetical protein